MNRRGRQLPSSGYTGSAGGAAMFFVSARVSILLSILVSATGGCGGVPWFLGAPLDGHPSIPARSRVVTVAEHRRNVAAAAAEGNRVVELAELKALSAREALRGDETNRLVELLLARANDWIALARPFALVADLREVLALAPHRKVALARPLRVAERAAGDQWLAMGQMARAEEEYRRADRDGATGMDYRFRAAWGAAVGDLDADALAAGLTELPARTLAPFSEAYLNGGGSNAALIYRAWRAARLYGPTELLQRIEAFPVAAAFPAARRSESRRAGASEAHRGEASRDVAPSTDAPPGPPPTEAQLFAGPTLARRLIPAAHRFPELTEPSARSRAWADRLIAEDPTSADSFELAALIEARGGRTDSAAQKLEELAFFSRDRADAAARAARVWEQAGQGRRACAAWEQAARLGAGWQADGDERWCQFLACAADHPGASERVAAARFVAARAPDLICARAGADAKLLEAPDEPQEEREDREDREQAAPPAAR